MQNVIYTAIIIALIATRSIVLCENKTICKTPLVRDHLNLSWSPNKVQYLFNETIEWRCDAGYNLEGNKSSLCQRNGQFTQSPICIPRTCAPLNVPNLIVEPNKTIYYVKDIVVLSCKRGFELVSKQDRTVCGFYGKFIHVVECIVSHCLTPDFNSVIMGMKSVKKTVYKFDDIIEFECYFGGVIDGSSRATCQRNGSFTRIPNCIQMPQTETLRHEKYQYPTVNNDDMLAEIKELQLKIRLAVILCGLNLFICPMLFILYIHKKRICFRIKNMRIFRKHTRRKNKTEKCDENESVSLRETNKKCSPSVPCSSQT